MKFLYIISLKQFHVAIVSSESFADSLHAGVVERWMRYVLCAQSACISLICRCVRQQSVTVFSMASRFHI